MDSHQRRLISREVLRQLQPDSAGNSRPPETLEKKPSTVITSVPWYERGLLWGLIGLVANILCTIISVQVKDLRWLLFATLPAVVICIWISLQNALKSRFHLFGSVSAGGVVWAALLIFLFNRLANDPFGVKLGPIVQFDKTPALSRYFVRYQYAANGKFVLNPVDVMMGIRLTNLESFGASISSIKVEEQTSDDRWVPLNMMLSRGGVLYIVERGDLRHASRVKTREFDREIERRYLGPHESAEGLAFLEAPDRSLTYKNRFRISVKDATGTTYKVKIFSEDPNVGTETSEIKKISDDDISNSQIIPYNIHAITVQTPANQ